MNNYTLVEGEPGTATNPLKASGTLREIAQRVKSGNWTTLDLETLADSVLANDLPQSQPATTEVVHGQDHRETISVDGDTGVRHVRGYVGAVEPAATEESDEASHVDLGDIAGAADSVGLDSSSHLHDHSTPEPAATVAIRPYRFKLDPRESYASCYNADGADEIFEALESQLAAKDDVIAELRVDIFRLLGGILDRIDMAPNDEPLPYIREYVEGLAMKWIKETKGE